MVCRTLKQFWRPFLLPKITPDDKANLTDFRRFTLGVAPSATKVIGYKS